MALTRDFRLTIVERVRGDPAFARALLDEAGTLFLKGEPQLPRQVLRELVTANLGFEQLAEGIGRPDKRVRRMLSDVGKPPMDDLAAIFGLLREELGVELATHAVR